MADRPRHLTVGWCWRCDVDGEPAVYGIYGQVAESLVRAGLASRVVLLDLVDGRLVERS